MVGGYEDIWEIIPYAKTPPALYLRDMAAYGGLRDDRKKSHMILLENLCMDAVCICIITPLEQADESLPAEHHWRCGLLNSLSGRERLLEVLADYPKSIHDVLATWGDSPTVIED